MTWDELESGSPLSSPEEYSGGCLSNIAIWGVFGGVLLMGVGGTALVAGYDIRETSYMLQEVGIRVNSLSELKSTLMNYGALLLLSGGVVAFGSWLALRSASSGSER